MPGYDIGASLAASSSSGSSTGSGAMDLGGGGNYGGTPYGPGSIVYQQGAIAGGTLNPFVLVAIAVAVVVIVLVWGKKGK